MNGHEIVVLLSSRFVKAIAGKRMVVMVACGSHFRSESEAEGGLKAGCGSRIESELQVLMPNASDGSCDISSWLSDPYMADPYYEQLVAVRIFSKPSKAIAILCTRRHPFARSTGQ